MEVRIYEVAEINGQWFVTHPMGRMPYSSRRAAIKSAVDAAHRDRQREFKVSVRVRESDGNWSDLHLF